MNQISRRSLLKGASGVTAAMLLTAHPAARLIHAQGDAEYDLVDLGWLEIEVRTGFPTGFGEIADINEAGAMAGRIGVNEGRFSPVRWSPDGARRRLMSGQFGAEAKAINAGGIIVGVSTRESGDPGRPHPATRPAYWSEMEPVYLPDLSGVNNAGTAHGDGAFDINDDGVIVGQISTPLIGETGTPVRWIGGTAERLPALNGNSSLHGEFINNAGTIAGWFESGAAGVRRPRPAIIRENEASPLALPEGVAETDAVVPVGLAENDAVAVRVYDAERDYFFGYLVDGEEITLIGEPGGAVNHQPRGLNDLGEVVGGLWNPGADYASAMLWRDGEAIDLNTRVAATALRLYRAQAINNAGVIAGLAAIPATDERHLVLLVPTE